MRPVIVYSVVIEPHPRADRLEIASLGGYRAVVGKGQFVTGDLAAFIPEQTTVPGAILKDLELEGCLAGPDKDRVKTARIRGVLSQGLCYPARPDWRIGYDATTELGVVKWTAPIPQCMEGSTLNAGEQVTVAYNVRNLKKGGGAFEDGEQVVVTEKVHGTFVQFIRAYRREDTQVGSGAQKGRQKSEFLVSSKGVGGRGHAYKTDTDNLYTRYFLAYGIEGLMVRAFGEISTTVVLCGEIYGQGVQDLTYGVPRGAFRFFDVRLGTRDQHRWLSDQELDQFAELAAQHNPDKPIQRVPVLWRGPYTRERIDELSEGVETVSGQGLHMREGVVVRPVVERVDYRGRRVQFKRVSDTYKLRRGGTEHN